jgi:hypothetical protein
LRARAVGVLDFAEEELQVLAQQRRLGLELQLAIGAYRANAPGCGAGQLLHVDSQAIQRQDCPAGGGAEIGEDLLETATAMAL